METKRHFEENSVGSGPKKQKIIVAQEIDILPNSIEIESDQIKTSTDGQLSSAANKQIVLDQESTIWLAGSKPTTAGDFSEAPGLSKKTECPTVACKASTSKSEPIEADADDRSIEFSSEHQPDGVMLDAIRPDRQEHDEGVRIAMNKIVDETLISFRTDNDLLKQLKSTDTIMKMLSGLFKSNNLINLNTMDEVQAVAAAVIQLNEQSRTIDSLLIRLTDEIKLTKSHIFNLFKQLQNPNEPKTAELQKLIQTCQRRSAAGLDDSFKLTKAALIANLLTTDTLAEMDETTTGCLFDLLILHLSTIFLLSIDSDKPTDGKKSASTSQSKD